MKWRLADAKNYFCELISVALVEGPQRVVRRDHSVMVVAQRNCDKLAGTRPDFQQFLLGKDPSLDSLDMRRDRSSVRDVELCG